MSADALHYFGGTVDLTSVRVTDTAGVLNGTPTEASYSAPTGGSVIVQFFAWNTMKVPSNGTAPNTECTLGATASIGGFSIEAVSPSYLCISAQNGTAMYITLGMPGRPYDGPITITIDDYVTNSSG